MKWYEWTRRLRDDCDAPPDVKALLITLSTYVDDDGRCYPSLATLAAKLNVHPDTAKRRRNRAMELGWLVVESPGRWNGTPTRYRLVLKGGAGASLPQTQRGASVGRKGVHGEGGKGGVDAPRTSITFQEGADGAPSLESARLAQTTKRERVEEAVNALSEENVPDLSERAWLGVLHNEGFETYGDAWDWLHDVEVAA